MTGSVIKPCCTACLNEKMIYDRYYYSILNKTNKEAYKTIYHAIENFSPVVSVTKKPGLLPLEKLLEYIELDNPHIFYVDFTVLRLSESMFSRFYQPGYLYTRAEADSIRQKVNTVITRLVSKIDGKTDYLKEKAVHDLLIENISYDRRALSNLRRNSPKTATILGVLFFKTAVCSGISKINKLLLNTLDIKCTVVYGTDRKSGEKHAWNVVKLGDESYHLDLTWDLGLSECGITRYDYFNLSEAEIEADHIIESPCPVCHYSAQNYFNCSNKLVSSADDIKKLISRIRFTDEPLYFRVYETARFSFDDALSFCEKNYAFMRVTPTYSYATNPGQKIIIFN